MMIRLYTLGTTHLLADGGRTFARVLTQPKHLALLSYLTVAKPGAFQRRDKLLALFWPEPDEKHARWALNQAVRRLRSELGSSVIASRGADAIAVSAAILWCDAVAFHEACAREDWSGAVPLYRGEFHGRDFLNDEDLNQQAWRWLERTANVRIHGTTKEQPLVRFERDEKALLQPLPVRPYRSLVLMPVEPTRPIRVAGVPSVAVERRPLSVYAQIAGGVR